MLPIKTSVFSLLLVASLVASAGNRVQPFVHYFDCLRTSKTPADIDVFMKIYNRGSQPPSKASQYSRGIDVDLVLADDNSLQGLQLGGFKGRVSIEDLKSGIQFGVLGKTMHTFELDKNFDPKKGGKLTMGYLTNVSVTSVIRSAFRSVNQRQESDFDLEKADKEFPVKTFGVSESLKRYYEKHKSGQWQQTSFDVVMEGGRWKLKNSQGQQVDTIFAEMKIPSPNIPLVQGISEVKSVMANYFTSCNFLSASQLADSPEQQEIIKNRIWAGQKKDILDCKRD